LDPRLLGTVRLLLLGTELNGLPIHGRARRRSRGFALPCRRRQRLRTSHGDSAIDVLKGEVEVAHRERGGQTESGPFGRSLDFANEWRRRSRVLLRADLYHPEKSLDALGKLAGGSAVGAAEIQREIDLAGSEIQTETDFADFVHALRQPCEHGIRIRAARAAKTFRRVLRDRQVKPDLTPS